MRPGWGTYDSTAAANEVQRLIFTFLQEAVRGSISVMQTKGVEAMRTDRVVQALRCGSWSVALLGTGMLSVAACKEQEGDKGDVTGAAAGLSTVGAAPTNIPAALCAQYPELMME